MVLLENVPGDTIFHRLNVTSKLIWLVTVIAGSYLFDNTIYIGAILLFVLACLLIAKIPIKRLIPYFKALFIPIIFLILYEAVTIPGTFTVLSIGFVKVTADGILLGLTFTFRLLIMILASTVFIFTTPLDQMLSLLKRMRAPYPLIFVLMVGIRFAPLLQREAMMTVDAQKARGLELEKWSGFKQLIKTYIPIMIPLLVNGIRKSQQLAMAIVARGFNPKSKWIPLEEKPLTFIDYLFSLAMILLLLVMIYIHMLGYGHGVIWLKGG